MGVTFGLLMLIALCAIVGRTLANWSARLYAEDIISKSNKKRDDRAEVYRNRNTVQPTLTEEELDAYRKKS